MERYIKLPNGLLDTQDFIITETETEDNWGNKVKAYEFKHKQDEKITLTIEENDILGDNNSLMPLCDLWVYEWCGKKTIYKNYESAKRGVKEAEWGLPSTDGHGEFYGLIWVNGIFGLGQPTLVPVCKSPFPRNGEAVLLPWEITREM